jgi:NADH-quinone oxidoreductase subunit I
VRRISPYPAGPVAQARAVTAGWLTVSTPPSPSGPSGRPNAPAQAPAAPRPASRQPVSGAGRKGLGLVAGLRTTGRTMLRPSHTREYPDSQPPLPPRSRGVIALLEENCTVCMLCARECPDWCIYIDSHKETLPAVEGGRERQRNVLDRFAIDFSLCMYCGICIDVCPFDALFWAGEFEYAETDIHNMLHEKERLAQWMASVPPPPLPDQRSIEPREVASARAATEKVLAEFAAAGEEGHDDGGHDDEGRATPRGEADP